jgi:hypothetical protein
MGVKQYLNASQFCLTSPLILFAYEIQPDKKSAQAGMMNESGGCRLFAKTFMMQSTP